MNPKLIRRAHVRDAYGTPATEFREAEFQPLAVAKELAAISLTALVMRGVRPGNINDLAKAEQRFNSLAAKGAK